MNRVLISAFAAAALAASAAPAFAQGSRPADGLPLQVRADHAAQQISDGIETGRLTDLQAKALRDQFKGLLNLEDDYVKSGMTENQRADLQARYDTLEARIQVDSHPAGVEVQRAPATTITTTTTTIDAGN
jgi:hypothetical protein